MGPPGGGRNDITGRFTRHMNVIAMDSFSDDTMIKIFTTITDWHFSKGFDASFSRAGKILVQATMDIYKQTIANFLPTPSKSHYVFNLRDFARVIRGVLLAPSVVMKEEKKLHRLWVHEIYRVFYDRLIDEADRETFFGMVKSVMAELMKVDIGKLLESLVPKNEKLADVHIRNLIFGDFAKPDATDKIYDEITDLDELSKVMEGLKIRLLSIFKLANIILF